MALPDVAAWPTPVFEGSEKRLEVDFAPSDHRGLRSLSRAVLDQLMTDAGCCIVSDRHNEQFDAYVLSESSLFVFPHKLVLKTCGTTKILHAIPLLLQLACSTGCIVKRCKYSRASFLYPQFQVSFAASLICCTVAWRLCLSTLQFFPSLLSMHLSCMSPLCICQLVFVCITGGIALCCALH